MKKNYLKLLALCMVAVMALFAFAGCNDTSDQQQGNNNDDETKTFIIGSIGPLTGGTASYGLSAKQGAEVAVAESTPTAVWLATLCNYWLKMTRTMLKNPLTLTTL